MGIDISELIVPFTGALQAAISVLLTIGFGVVAAQCNLLTPSAAKEVSKLCVRMFLPALLIYKIGSNLHQDTAVRYIPILSKFDALIRKLILTRDAQYGLYFIRFSPSSSAASSRVSLSYPPG